MVEFNARTAVESMNIEAQIEKVTEQFEIRRWNIFSTPGLVINGKVVCAGRIPEVAEITTWLTDELEKSQ